MDSILIAGIFHSVLLSVLLIMKKDRNVSDMILLALMVLLGLTVALALAEIYNRQFGYPFPAIISASVPPIFLHGPLLWFYIRSHTDQHFGFKPILLLHFLPFVLVTMLLAHNTYSLPAEQKIAADMSESFRNDPAFPIIIGLIIVFTQGYFIWGLQMLSRYHRNLKVFFSKTEGIDLKWLRLLLILSIVSYAVISLLYAADYIFELMPYATLQMTGYFFATVFLLLLGIAGLHQGNIFASHKVTINLEQALMPQPEPAKLLPEEVDSAKKLLLLMKEEKPHLNPELTIARLGEQMNMSPENLSELLNGRLNMNFFDFVNHYRVEEFKQMCQAPESKNFSILGMAYDCGFNSKATFNRVFKKMVQLTPGEYLKQVSKK